MIYIYLSIKIYYDIQNRQGGKIMLDFRIDTFLAVCSCMNFTRAAKELNITQPAVSQHIRHLEENYQTKLFQYEGKKISLTKAGELLRNAALTMTHDEKFLQQQMSRAEEDIKRITFGATMTVGEVVMSDIIARYLKEYPDVKLHMEVANTKELLARLDNGGIDFALVEGFFPKREYDFWHYSTEAYIGVCSAGYDFTKSPKKMEDLFGERLLLRENGSGTREVLTRFLDSQNLSTEDFMQTAEIGSLHTIKELVKAGCGITFLYEVAVREELQNKTMKKIELENFHLMHDFTFIWRKGSIYSEMYTALFRQFTG